MTDYPYDPLGMIRDNVRESILDREDPYIKQEQERRFNKQPPSVTNEQIWGKLGDLENKINILLNQPKYEMVQPPTQARQVSRDVLVEFADYFEYSPESIGNILRACKRHEVFVNILDMAFQLVYHDRELSVKHALIQAAAHFGILIHG